MSRIASAIERQERRKARADRRLTAQPLPRPPKPPPTTPATTRDLRPGPSGHYVTKGHAGPGDDDDDDQDDHPSHPLNRRAEP